MHEHEQYDLEGAERELEAALRGLKPGPAAIDPIACAFEAGRRISANRARAWQSTSAALLLVLLASILIPAERHDARNRVPDGNFATSVSLPRATNGSHTQTYLTARDAVLARGVDVLPASSGSAKPVSMHGL